MATNKNKQVRNDWSDDNAIDGDLSLMQETEMRSIISTDDKMAPSPNQQLQQNSLFSSIQGQESIRGGHSV